MSTPETAAVLAHFRAGDAWRNLSWELADRFPSVPEAEREDRLQQAFVIALEKCRATDRGGVYEFLRIAARREVLHLVNGKAHSTRHGDPEFDFDALAGREGDPLEELLHAERVAAIRTCVDELSERRRAVLVRRLCNGESRADIAAALGASLKTVKTQLEHASRDFHRAVRRTAGSACQEEWEEPVAALAFGAYEPDEAIDVTAHLEECVECRAYHDNLRWIASAAAAMLPLPALTRSPIGGLASLRHPFRRLRHLAAPGRHAAEAKGTAAASGAVGAASAPKIAAIAVSVVAIAGAGYEAHATRATHPASRKPTPALTPSSTARPASLPSTPTPHKAATPAPSRTHQHHKRQARPARASQPTQSTQTSPQSASRATTPAPAPKPTGGSGPGGEFF